MTRRLLVNDCLTCIPGTRTFWHDLMDWFGMEFVGGDYATLAETASARSTGAWLIIRNATWFGPIKATCPQIALLQDIITEGPQREMQKAVIESSRAAIFNSAFTASQYGRHKILGDSTVTEFCEMPSREVRIIPLPVDFSLFEPQNAMGCQQALSLPDGAVCWVGASQNAAGHVKGWDIFIKIVRRNPDIPFVAIFKDQAPEWGPPNLRMYARLPQTEMVKVIGACRLGLCTSRMESQHLAGIEMGACGLPLVAPKTGTYWKRDGMPGFLVDVPSDAMSAKLIEQIVRTALSEQHDQDQVRAYWQREFDKPVVKAQWEKLIAEAECSGQS